MNQLTKEEILQQLLGLNSSDLLEIESTIQTMHKLGINLTSNKSKKQVAKISVSNKTKEQLQKSVISLNQDSIENARFSNGLYCISCGCVDGIVKNGKRKNGLQKYKCKNCGHYFSGAKDSVLSGTHKRIEVWETFVWCMNEKYTLSKAAEKCNIHRNTAFMWRHKILNALRDKEKVMLGGIVEADDTFFLVSYKGNHKNAGNFATLYGRAARKRGGENHTKGLSHEQACVACGVDRSQHSFSTVAGTAALTSEKIEKVFTGVIQKESVLCTDGVLSYNDFAQNNNLQLETINATEKQRGIYHLNNVNSYHSVIKAFVSQFKGVSTKYLNNYLLWCNWVQRKKMKDKLRIDTMLKTSLEYKGKIRYCDVLLGAL